MKKLFVFAILFVLVISACGPAAENRDQMHARAKVFQDSIARAIRTSMDEAAAPGANQPQPVPADTSKKPAAAATATAK